MMQRFVDEGFAGRARGVLSLSLGVLVGISLLALPIAALGQSQNAGIVGGRVTDSAGAAVPNASVRLQDKDQGRTVSSVTSSQGEYVFNSVPVGTYSLTISAATFATSVVADLSVSADQNSTFNAVLKPGSQEVSVTVEAEGSGVDTSSATIGTLIDNALVEGLPLDGNNAVELAALLPGVTDVNAPTTFTSDTGGPTYTVSGARANQNLLLLDGALWNNLYNNTGLNFPPRQGLQEVTVLLNNFKAQYGRNVGSVFNVVTKRGSNSYHGQLWEFAQNKAFNASDYLSHANPKLVQNQFGASIAGPIIRDKLFFALTYQDLRSAAAVTAQAPTLTINERGITTAGGSRPCVSAAFAALAGGCASFTEDLPPPPPPPPGTPPPPQPTLNNPIKGSNSATATSALNAAYQLAGGTGTSPCVTALLAQPTTLSTMEFPSVCFNPVAQNLLKRFPLPTIPIPGAALPYAVTFANQPRNDQDGLARIDWNLGRHTLAARYYQTAVNDQTANGVSAGLGIANYEINANTGGIHHGNIDDNWVITNNLLNVVRAAYKRYDYTISPLDPTSLSSLGSQLNQPGHPTLPRISIDSRFGVGTANLNYSVSVNENVEFDDSISYTKGKHNIQGGAEYLRLQYLHIFDQAPSLSFNNVYTGVPAADFMLGLVSSSSFGNSTNQAAVQHDLYLYLQDDWRATPRLTLNLGLRYEIPFQWVQPDGQAATFAPGYQSIKFPTAPPNVAFVGDPGVQNSLVGTTYRNLAPRFGFAYDVYGNGQTSLRGGFGIFYDAINALVVGVSQPYHFQETPSQLPGGLSQPLLNLPAIPGNYVKGQAPQFVIPYSITFPDANFTTPYSEAVNLGIQQKMPHSGVFELNYVGRFGRHQALGFDLNPAIYDCSGSYFQSSPSTYCLPAGSTSVSSFTTTAGYLARVKYPNFNYGGSGVLDYVTVGTSSYNALQTIYTMRAKKSLTMIVSYTFSKSLDVSSNAISIANTAEQPSLNSHRAPSDFDSRHIFNFGYTFRLPSTNRFNAPVRAVLNGWSLSGIYNARTGHPFSITTTGDVTLTQEKPEFVSYVAGGYTPRDAGRHRVAKVAEWFNTASVCLPSQISSVCPTLPGGYGNAPRNALVGPAFINTNFSVSREFPVVSDRGIRFILRADAFNAFNTPNLGQPQSSLSGNSSKNTTFGTIISTVGSNGAVGTNGRRLQLSGNLTF